MYEAPLDLVQGLIVPTSLFFVRNHFPTPVIDLKTWRLRVEGGAVERPVEFTYDELLKLPARTQPVLVECAGNGRAFYSVVEKRPVQGVPWGLGGVSLGEWTGVSLADVLSQARLKPRAVDVLLEGLDEGKVARPIPVSVALDPGTLLAYALNGEALPPDHGFPLRAIVPGWTGISNIKWLGLIAVEDTPIRTRYNTEQYVLKGPDHPDRPPVTQYGVKSVLALPWEAVLPAGSLTLGGFAWSPHGKIAVLEYSLDGGETWSEARLAGPNNPFAWTRWEFPWQATPGDYTVSTRATDDKDNAQPDGMPWNEQGYLYHALVPHPVKVV